MIRGLKSKLIPAVLVSLAGIFTFSGWLYHYASTPTTSEATPHILVIKRGMTLRQITRELDNSQLIDTPRAFALLAFLKGKQNKILAGEYRLSAAMTPQKILDTITSGKFVLYTLTIPEGFRILEIADLVASSGLGEKNRFLEATRNPEWIQTFDIPGRNLEGYLFPDTYKFPKNTSEAKIVETMLKTFQDKASGVRKRALEMNLSLHEVVTLASIIEKETGQASERRLISSVFHNRLKKNMRLQTDPTVIYALANFDGNIRKKDLSVESPYNTYLYPGLPPGPIASPGLKALEAALDPAETDYLYFVSRQDGTHQFSTNLEDHNRAVTRFQINKRKG